MVEALDVKSFQRAPDRFGSVDIGNVSYVVPAIHVLVDIAAGMPYANQVLLKAGKGLSLTGYDILFEVQFCQQAKASFKKSLHKP
jgi:hypothetical protein